MAAPKRACPVRYRPCERRSALGKGVSTARQAAKRGWVLALESEGAGPVRAIRAIDLHESGCNYRWIFAHPRGAREAWPEAFFHADRDWSQPRTCRASTAIPLIARWKAEADLCGPPHPT